MKWPAIDRLTPEARRKNLCRAISLSFDSLETHLLHAIKAPKSEYAGDEKFNATTIREYAEVILICAVELEILARRASRKKKDKK
jgi:hypothetical protein